MPLSLLLSSADKGLDTILWLETLRISGKPAVYAVDVHLSHRQYARFYDALGHLAAHGALRTLVWDDHYRARPQGWPSAPGAYLDLRKVPYAARLLCTLGASGHVARLHLRLHVDTMAASVAAVVADHVSIDELGSTRNDREALRRCYEVLLGKVRSLEIRNLKSTILPVLKSPVLESLSLVWDGPQEGSLQYLSTALGYLPNLKELRIEGARRHPQATVEFFRTLTWYENLRVLTLRGSLFNDHNNVVMDSLRSMLDESQHAFWPRLEALDVGGQNNVFARNTEWVFPFLEVASNRLSLAFLRMGQDANGFVRRIVRAREYKYRELNGLVVSVEPVVRT